MNKSEAISDLAMALAKAQAELKNPPFDSKNPHFKSNYASLASVRDTVVAAFSKNGLSIVQNVSSCDTGVSCSNIILHTSGQWLETDRLEIPADKHNAHGYGSACTYARRFSLMALACVVGDVDDDANAAVKNNEFSSIDVRPNSGAGEKLTNDKKNYIADLAIVIKDLWEIDEFEKMYDECSNLVELDEKNYLWSLLDSKIKSKITSIGKERKK